jgi:hypothetical protein
MTIMPAMTDLEVFILRKVTYEVELDSRLVIPTRCLN